MADLFRTDKVDKHTHIVYIRDDGTGVTDSKSHPPHQIQDGVMFGEDHSHEIVPIVLKSKKSSKKDDGKLIGKVLRLFQEWSDNEKDSREKGKESEDFMMLKQWDDTDKSKLKAEQRAALTLDHVGPNMRLLSGHQRQNRTDIKYFPEEDGDARVADILNHVTKNILENTNYHFEETHVFEDQTVVGRGFLHFRIDRTDKILGEIKVERWPWDEIYLGPHEKFDLSDLEGLIKSKMYSTDKVKQLWPNKAKDIQSNFDFLTSDGAFHKRKIGLQYAVGEGKDINLASFRGAGFVDLKRKEFRVMELMEKEFRRVNVLFDPLNDFFFNAEIEGLSEKEISMAKTIEDLSVAPRQTHQMRRTIVAGGVLLQNEIIDETELPFNDFDIIPVYATKKGSTFQGKVESVKDPQREINKRHSQTADILNRHASYVWFFDDNTFNTPKDEQQFRADVAKAGATIKVRDRNRLPEKVDGAKFPSELINFASIEQEQTQFILNINPELRGFQGQAESGIAIVEKNRQGLLGNEYLFDNLSFAKKLLGKRLVSMIQATKSPEDIMRLIESIDGRSPIEIGGEQLGDIMNPEEETATNPEDIRRLLEETDLTRFDVVVGESAFNVSNRRANFVMWAEMARNGFPVPPDLLVDLSDLPDKEKVKQKMGQIQRQQQQESQADRETEVLKTKIANQPEAQLQ